MSTELAMWLLRQRQDRGWSRLDKARRLIRAGQEAGDTSMPTLESMDHNVYRWERGPDAPSERFMLCYCRVLGISVDEYGPSEPVQVGLSNATAAVAVLAAPGITAAPWLAQLPPGANGHASAASQPGHPAARPSARRASRPDLPRALPVWQPSAMGAPHAVEPELPA